MVEEKREKSDAVEAVEKSRKGDRWDDNNSAFTLLLAQPVYDLPSCSSQFGHILRSLLHVLGSSSSLFPARSVHPGASAGIPVVLGFYRPAGSGFGRGDLQKDNGR